MSVVHFTKVLIVVAAAAGMLRPGCARIRRRKPLYLFDGAGRIRYTRIGVGAYRSPAGDQSADRANAKANDGPGHAAIQGG